MAEGRKKMDRTKEYCVEAEGGLRCACSRQGKSKVGTGTTTAIHLMKMYYYIEQTGPKSYGMWLINDKHVPVGDMAEVQLSDIMREHHPEVRYYIEKVAPAMRKLRVHIARGDKHRRNGEPFTAEMEYSNALKLDESNVRAMFGLGLLYLEYGEKTKGGQIFGNLIDMDAAFKPEHKHLFNEFGIQLRKNGMFDEAMQYYGKALSLCEDDENLHFNLARSCYEGGDLLAGTRSLARSLELHPSSGVTLGFLRHLVKELRERLGKKRAEDLDRIKVAPEELLGWLAEAASEKTASPQRRELMTLVADALSEAVCGGEKS